MRITRIFFSVSRFFPVLRNSTWNLLLRSTYKIYPIPDTISLYSNARLRLLEKRPLFGNPTQNGKMMNSTNRLLTLFNIVRLFLEWFVLKIVCMGFVVVRVTTTCEFVLSLCCHVNSKKLWDFLLSWINNSIWY